MIEESFGIVPLSYQSGEVQVFLVQLNAGHWGFPKGHAEEGESPIESASRELREETNLEIVRFLLREPLIETYQFQAKGVTVRKQVSYFVAEVAGEVFLQAEEVSQGLWFSFKQAMDHLTYPEGRAILTQVIQRVADL